MPDKIYHVSGPLANIPEMTLVIREIQGDEAQFPSITLPNGTMRPRSISLAELRSMLGGNEGDLPDFSGNLHHVSLKAWENADPDKTFLSVTFIYKGSQDPAQDPIVRAMEASESDHPGSS